MSPARNLAPFALIAALAGCGTQTADSTGSAPTAPAASASGIPSDAHVTGCKLEAKDYTADQSGPVELASYKCAGDVEFAVYKTHDDLISAVALGTAMTKAFGVKLKVLRTGENWLVSRADLDGDSSPSVATAPSSPSVVAPPAPAPSIAAPPAAAPSIAVPIPAPAPPALEDPDATDQAQAYWESTAANLRGIQFKATSRDRFAASQEALALCAESPRTAPWGRCHTVANVYHWPSIAAPPAPAAPRPDDSDASEPSRSTGSSGSCTPLTNGGRCYQPGEFCRKADHGITGRDAQGQTITCEDNNGWRWEPR